MSGTAPSDARDLALTRRAWLGSGLGLGLGLGPGLGLGSGLASPNPHPHPNPNRASCNEESPVTYLVKNLGGVSELRTISRRSLPRISSLGP